VVIHSFCGLVIQSNYFPTNLLGKLIVACINLSTLHPGVETFGYSISISPK